MINKNVLILGGTGAMGRPLQDILIKKGFDVSVTSRSKHESSNVTYYQGDAHDTEFLKKVLYSQNFCAVIDFMTYSSAEFENIVDIILPNTSQYIFMSSARVYAESESLITEKSPRILDVCSDITYLKTDEYALKKAREEDVLIARKEHNWTIIRPSITYNDERLQMPVAEKEDWLYRVLEGRSIVFPRDLINTRTTMSYGKDVAKAIGELVDNEKAFGQIIHVAGAKSITWGDVLDIYIKALKPILGNINVVYVDDVKKLSVPLGKEYQVKYARAINREFDNTKLFSIIGKMNFISAEEGLTKCVKAFVEGQYKFKTISWKNEALMDRLSNEKTPLKAFPKIKWKIMYLVARYLPYFSLKR